MDKFLFLFVMVLCVSCTSSLYAERPNRITNGLFAAENQFPYMISLQQLDYVQNLRRGHKCGGALVTLQHAVTSAYCTFYHAWTSYETNLTPIHRAHYRVFAGSVELTNDTSADRIRRIADITRHPDFNTSLPRPTNWFLNDIAVITLGTPFLSNTVAPLSVIDIGSETGTCTLSGWGLRTQLMYAQMWALNETMCLQNQNGSLSLELSPSMVCGWASLDNEGAAGTWADEGGPLVCRGGLVGIFIYSVPLHLPQLYTRVSNYTTWINNVLAQPIPELGPELTTPTPPTLSPFPGGASTFQPGFAVLALIAIVQIIAANFIN